MSGGKEEKTAGDKPWDENGMGGRVVLKEGWWAGAAEKPQAMLEATWAVILRPWGLEFVSRLGGRSMGGGWWLALQARYDVATAREKLRTSWPKFVVMARRQ